MPQINSSALGWLLSDLVILVALAVVFLHEWRRHRRQSEIARQTEMQRRLNDQEEFAFQALCQITDLLGDIPLPSCVVLRYAVGGFPIVGVRERGARENVFEVVANFSGDRCGRVDVITKDGPLVESFYETDIGFPIVAFEAISTRMYKLKKLTPAA